MHRNCNAESRPNENRYLSVPSRRTGIAGRCRERAADPKRGDIISLDFDPSAGHEQQGTRPALVLSPEAFNRFGLALACPVTRGGAFARGQAWTVALTGAGLATDGRVLCNQVRTLDWKARHAQFIEAVPPELIADVLARVATLIE